MWGKVSVFPPSLKLRRAGRCQGERMHQSGTKNQEPSDLIGLSRTRTRTRTRTIEQPHGDLSTVRRRRIPSRGGQAASGGNTEHGTTHPHTAVEGKQCGLTKI